MELAMMGLTICKDSTYNSVVMTVCIAASYNNGEGFVLTSDQMLTLHYPMAYSYENEEFEKISLISDKLPIYCLSAGNAIFAQEIIDTAKTQIKNKDIKLVDQAAQEVCEAYVRYRLLRLIRSQLQIRGLDLNSYYKNHRTLSPDTVQLIDRNFRITNLGVEFIIVGASGSSCHIYTVIHPGDMFCYDSIGYAAIGVGAPHVTYHMIENSYRKSMSREATEQLVDKAKKRSEVAPGVGKKTTTIIEPKEAPSDL